MMTRQDIVVLYEQGVDDVVELVQALFAHMEQQRAQIAAQQEQITALTERVKELEDRLSKNTPNSDKPPSSDFPLSPRPKSLRAKKSTKKPGGQPFCTPARYALLLGRGARAHPQHPQTLSRKSASTAAHPPARHRGFGPRAQRREVVDLCQSFSRWR
jgi:uncharacterized coiled-coil protein SlyX